MTNEATFQPANRSNTSLLAGLEKRALLWIAERLPAGVNSDHLTVLGFVSLIATGALYWSARTNRWVVLLTIVGLALNWFGDSLDGTLARVRHQQRPRYGFYVDHIADIFGSVALMCGLGLSGFLHWQTSIAMLIAFLLLSSESYLATYTLSRDRKS